MMRVSGRRKQWMGGLRAAVAVAAVLLGSGPRLSANTFNSGKLGQPVINGVGAGAGSLYTLTNINSDQFIQSNAGTAVVWSAYDDHVLRKYHELGGAFGAGTDYSNHWNFGFNDYTMNSSVMMGFNGYYTDGSPLWTMQFQLSLGIYGEDSYLQKSSEPYVQFNPDSPTFVYGVGAAPGDQISAVGISNSGISVYNKATIDTSTKGPPGSFDIVAAWGGVVDHFATLVGNIGEEDWYKPSENDMRASFQYFDNQFGLSKLPTVKATWQGSYSALPSISISQCENMIRHAERHSVDVCNTAGAPTSFMMIDGTGSRLCDPVQLQFYPLIASAVFAVNGVYCEGMQVNNQYALGSPVPLPPPVAVKVSDPVDSPAPLGGIQSSNYLMNPGIGVPPRLPVEGVCVDSALNGDC